MLEKLRTKTKRKGGLDINSFLKKRIEKEIYLIHQPFSAKDMRIRIVEHYGTKYSGSTITIGNLLARMNNVEPAGKGLWRVIDGD